MLDEHTIRNGHLTGEAIAGLACGAFDERDTALLLCHLEACPACMDAYIDAVSAADPAEPPDGCAALEERILASIGKENRRAKNRVVLAGRLDHAAVFQRRFPEARRKHHLVHPADQHPKRAGAPARPFRGQPLGTAGLRLSRRVRLPGRPHSRILYRR